MQPETLEFYPKWPSFQSWNFARTDNYLQDKHGLSKKNKTKQNKKNKKGSNTRVYLVDYTCQNCDHVLNQAFRFHSSHVHLHLAFSLCVSLNFYGH